MSSNTDKSYKLLLDRINSKGEELETRNHKVKSFIGMTAFFDSVPLVTLRKTAWKKALREMEWFLSGDPLCPPELKDWWQGQLNPEGMYINGYGEQLRRFGCVTQKEEFFDQIEWLIKNLKSHPHSRRLLTTTWNPQEMAEITEVNSNPNVPTTCHGSLSQYFVRNETLHMITYQRSSDMLLGVPHNWIQYWAYLKWLAHRTGYKMGTLQWNFGDAHIYQHPTHVKCVEEVLKSETPPINLEMVYTPSSEDFKATDFSIKGNIPTPVTTVKPKLL